MINTNSQIAILALQGAFVEHQVMMESLGAEVFLVRRLADVKDRRIDGVILPGGESTTMTKLLKKTGLDVWLKDQGKKGMPIFGTCAGVILLADMGLLDVEVERNAYGSQLESFETELELCLKPDSTTSKLVPPGRDRNSKQIQNSKLKIQKLFNGIFIRAPKIKTIGKSATVLAKYNDVPVLVRQKNILAASFHPELTEDGRIHKYFLDIL